jgi:hypothetical protein
MHSFKLMKMNRKGDGASFMQTTLGKILLWLLFLIFGLALLSMLFKDRIMPFLANVGKGIKGLLFS